MLFSVRDIDVCNIFYFSKMNWIELITAIFLLTKKQSLKLKLKLIIKMLPFLTNFVWEAYVIIQLR